MKTMVSRQYTCGSAKVPNSCWVVVDHLYSILAWIMERISSYTTIAPVRGVFSQQTEKKLQMK